MASSTKTQQRNEGLTDRLKRCGDLLVAVLVTGALIILSSAFRAGLPDLPPAVRANVYVVSATIYGALMGFIITGLAVLVSVPSKGRLELLRAAGQLEKAVRAFSRTAKWLGIGALVSITCLIVDRGPHPVGWCVWIFTGVLVGSLYRMTVSIWVLDQVVHMVTRSSAAD